MFSFLKKLSGSKESLPATGTSDSATLRGGGGGRSDAQDTLASLGLDPSLLADPEDDDIDPSVDHDPSLAADLDAVQKGTLQAAKPKPKTAVSAAKKPVQPAVAAATGAVPVDGELDLEAIHRDLLSGGDDLGSDDEVEIHEHEMADLEAQLAELTGLSPDELELAALETELNAKHSNMADTATATPKSTPASNLGEAKQLTSIKS